MVNTIKNIPYKPAKKPAYIIIVPKISEFFHCFL